jgi:transcriptional regulator with XRE-family HTH domain
MRCPPSRTYVSALERGLKSPTLPKVDALSGVLGLHPLTLLALSYGSSLADIENVLARVGSEAKEIFDTAEARMRSG